MMNHRFFQFVVLSLLCAGVLLKPMGDTVWAIEFPSDQSNASEQVSPDVGTEVIQTAIEAGQPPFKPTPIGSQVREYLSQRSVQKGWNADKQIFISVGTVYFDSEDPSYDDTFVTKRSLKTMQATLEAKAKIIEYVNTNMTAMDQVRIPGTDLANKFKQEFDKQEKKLLRQKEIIAKLLAHVDKTEAEKLNGVTISDRLNRLMDAAIAKLDKSYNAGQIEEKKLKKFEKAKQRYKEAMAEHDRLEEELAKHEGTLKGEQKSIVATFSKMPLMGAVPVAQFESWDEDSEKYSLAIVVMWSVKMQEFAKALVSGESLKAPPGKMSLPEWIGSQNWATATGGRRFRDNNGVVHFIGISAQPVGSSSSSLERAQGMAELFAKKEVATAIFSDVVSKKKAEQMMQTRSGGAEKDQSAAAATFAKTLQQSIQDRQINGLQELYGDELVHPISQQKIYVSIFGVSSDSAKQALFMEEESYLARLFDVKQQQQLKGKSDGHAEAVNRANQDTREYNAARAAAISNVTQRAETYRDSQFAQKNTRVPGNMEIERKRSAAQGNGRGRSQSGSHTGAGGDSFSW